VYYPQLQITKTIIESISTREPLEPKEPGLLTLEDLYPHVTEKQKSDCLQQFTVRDVLFAHSFTADGMTHVTGIEGQLRVLTDCHPLLLKGNTWPQFLRSMVDNSGG
jgi:hypothetical protein